MVAEAAGEGTRLLKKLHPPFDEQQPSPTLAQQIHLPVKIMNLKAYLRKLHSKTFAGVLGMGPSGFSRKLYSHCRGFVACCFLFSGGLKTPSGICRMLFFIFPGA